VRALPLLALLGVLSGPAACGADPSSEVDLGVDDLAAADLAGADDAAAPDLAHAPLQTTQDVTILVEPEDESDALVNAITGAQTSVHMTMYLLSAQPVIDALVARKQAGKDVKVLLNKSFPNGMGTNATVYSALTTAGVEVQWAPTTFQYTHAKVVIVDATKAFIMTMNATGSAFTDNREYVAIDTDAADVAEAEAIFQADWTGAAITPTGKLLTAPANAEDRLVALVDQAASTVDVEAEIFSAASILEALGRADKRGVAVRVVLSDETPSAAQTQAVNAMKAVDIPVRQLKTPFLHAKTIVVDGQRAYVGSINFTVNSLTNNRELGVVVGKKAEVDKIAAAFALDFAAATPL
jgi:cardiolipin synthase A/B